jgi:hypothetical protein
LRLGNVTGLDIHIYPGFVMMRGDGSDFALIEFRELSVGLMSTNFVEEERVPSDSEVVGQTWKKVNKDGSRDKRFNGNYQIPLTHYGELTFQSPTGLLEVYMVSSFAKTQAFAAALTNYQRALADLAARSNHTPTEILQLPPANIDEAPTDEVSEPQPIVVPESPKSMVLDWIGLVAIVIGLAAGGYGAIERRDDIKHLFAPQITVAARAPDRPGAAAAPTPSPPPAVVEIVYVQKAGSTFAAGPRRRPR